MKKIMFLTSSMNRGGAERVISILAEHYRQKGYQVAILQLLHNKNGYELHPDIEVLDCSNDKRKLILDLPRLIRCLRKTIKAKKPDVIVSFINQNCIFAYIASRGLHCPLICSERNDPATVHHNSFYLRVLNYVYAHCDKTVLQTKRVYNFFTEAVQQNSCIIGNPVSPIEQRCDHTAKRLVTVGRLAPQKNQKMLIDAFSDIHESYPDWHLDIYGEGTLQDDLQAQIDELGLTDYIHLHGNVLDLHERMQSNSIFVLPSNHEGLSNALLEAMTMGFPCISTNCAGSDEVIEHGKNGLLVPVGDKDKMADALAMLMGEEEVRRQMGVEAIKTAESYSIDNVIRQWETVIELDAGEEQA